MTLPVRERSRNVALQAPKPSPGPHKTRECLPLVLILRNRLKCASLCFSSSCVRATGRAARYSVHSRCLGAASQQSAISTTVSGRCVPLQHHAAAVVWRTATHTQPVGKQ